MSQESRIRTRSERVASLVMPPSPWEKLLQSLGNWDVVSRVGLCLLSAVAILAIMRAWNPPFNYRSGFVPSRDIVARVNFSDPKETAAARDRARRQIRCVYEQDPEPLTQLRAGLLSAVKGLLGSAEKQEDYSESTWKDFAWVQPEDQVPAAQRVAPEEQFRRFHKAVSGEDAWKQFEADVALIFSLWERDGLLDKLQHQPETGDQKEIVVHARGAPRELHVVKIEDILIGNGLLTDNQLNARLKDEAVVRSLSAWLKNHPLPPTLRLNKDETDKAREDAAKAVPMQIQLKGTTLVRGGERIDDDKRDVLFSEHEAFAESRTWGRKIQRASAMFGLLLALFVLSAIYVMHRERRLISSVGRLAALLLLVIGTVALSRWMAGDPWRAELLPMLLCGMIVALSYRQELAILISVAVSLVVVLTIGQNLGEFIILTGVVSSSVLQLNRVRSRTKLISVGMICGLIAFGLTAVRGLTENQPFSQDLMLEAGRNFLWALAGGFLMTGLLPFIERFFGALTEISLLELGDVAHPLLQELVRRAPGTYNHSINVATIAEVAAESIGAKGLLVRVGAYFHDIGKMFKPTYFVENQSEGENRHDSLVPAMSTLIIIAHVKDGADLARQHHIPKPIVEFIEQHHGTTLVEYFYHLASTESEDKYSNGEVEESSFRYPGPKPQTKEACVLMLADAVEGACRALDDPTPARIEGLVGDIAMKRLLDGQFDESGLTLQELRKMQDSLVKSLTAVYHSRIKYPEHQHTA